MADPNWLGYIGAITGTVGAITGVAGAIMGFKGYSASKEHKALDLRLELRKKTSDLRGEVDQLIALLHSANASHNAVAAADGSCGSGAFLKWLADWESDVSAVEKLRAELPDAGIDHRDAKPNQLETMLVENHSMQARAKRFREKYEHALEKDDRARDNLRTDIRSH